MTKRRKTDELAAKAAGLHPVIIRTFKSLVQGPEGEPYALNQDLVNGLFTVMVKLKKKKQLKQIVLGLRAMAKVAKERWGCPTLAEQIRLLLEHPEVIAALKKVKLRVDAETVAKTAERFERFTGGQVKKTAKRVGEEKPEGTLTLDQLNFPKRL